MIINNGLPEPLYKAICKINGKYSPGESDITVTQLIDSPYIRLLRQEHAHELVEKATECIWRFFGSLTHQILQEYEGANSFNEERLYVKIGGKLVGGQFDSYDYDSKILSDYKFTKNYAIKNGAKEEWVAQLNCLRFILVKNGFAVEKLRLDAILRDSVAARGEVDFKSIDIPMWTLEEAERYLHERIIIHYRTPLIIPPCTDKERWYMPGKVALMKKGRKTAVTLYDTAHEAENAITGKGKEYYIENRPGVNRRCEAFCNVSRWCRWWLSSKEIK